MRRFFCLALYVALLPAALANVQASIQPSTGPVGATFELTLAASGQPRILQFPNIRGMKWASRSPHNSFSNTRIVNGRATVQSRVSYALEATQPGKHTIPPLQVQVAGRTYRTSPLTVVATSVDHLMQIRFAPGKDALPKEIFLGERLPVVVDFLYEQRASFHRSFMTPKGLFPDISGENVVFQEFEFGRVRVRFEPTFTLPDGRSIQGRQENVDGKRFQLFPYRAYAKAISTGQMRLTVEHDVPLISGNRVQTLRVKRTSEAIDVKPLPQPASEDGAFLGLVGKWQVNGALSLETVKAGDSVDFTLQVSGSGGIDSLLVPDLQFAGFRQFEPKLERDEAKDAGTITWTLIPSGEAAQFPTITVCSFDPQASAYDRHVIQLPLSIEPPDEMTGGTTGGAVLHYTQETENPNQLLSNAPAQAARDILYIKRGAGQAVLVPLWHNVRAPLLAGILLGPLLFGLAHVFATRRERLSGSEVYRRKHEASRQRSQVLAAVRNATPETLPQIVRQQVTPYVRARLGLPPGATTDEIIQQLNDEELAEMLRLAEQGSFMPGAVQGLDASKILRQLGKLAVVVLSVCCAFSVRGDADAAYLAFEQGKVEDARAHYESLLSRRRSNADILYNLGCCAYRQGDFGASVAYFERARRLKPGDSDIVENLNFVRRQLGLPAVQTDDSPGAMFISFRDRFRPDQWLLFAVACWLIGWGLLALQRVKGWRLRPYAVATAAVALGCLLATFTQQSSTYRPNQAMIVEAETGLYPSRQPATGGDEPTATLAEGTTAEIRDQGMEWVRVRAENVEGWVKASAVARIW